MALSAGRARGHGHRHRGGARAREAQAGKRRVDAHAGTVWFSTVWYDVPIPPTQTNGDAPDGSGAWNDNGPARPWQLNHCARMYACRRRWWSVCVSCARVGAGAPVAYTALCAQPHSTPPSEHPPPPPTHTWASHTFEAQVGALEDVVVGLEARLACVRRLRRRPHLVVHAVGVLLKVRLGLQTGCRQQGGGRGSSGPGRAVQRAGRCGEQGGVSGRHSTQQGG